MKRFKVIMTGRNHPEWMAEALDSVVLQTDEAFDVCVVDDASEDPRSPAICQYAAEEFGWTFLKRQTRSYALANQVLAWQALDPSDDDVIVWVDLDDRLPVEDALETVRRYYEAGALLTYGSYQPFPRTHPNAQGCRPAALYDPMTRGARAYRQVGIQGFNHLRTCSWKVLKHVTDDDLRRSDGSYFQANTDRAVFWPALEIAGDRVAFIPDVLYEYRCDSEDAVWRSMNDLLVREDGELRRRAKKEALCV